MELAAHDIFICRGRRDRNAVLRGCQQTLITIFSIEAVDKVDVIALFAVFKQWMLLSFFPSDAGCSNPCAALLGLPECLL